DRPLSAVCRDPSSRAGRSVLGPPGRAGRTVGVSRGAPGLCQCFRSTGLVVAGTCGQRGGNVAPGRCAVGLVVTVRAGQGGWPGTAVGGGALGSGVSGGGRRVAPVIRPA